MSLTVVELRVVRRLLDLVRRSCEETVLLQTAAAAPRSRVADAEAGVPRHTIRLGDDLVQVEGGGEVDDWLDKEEHEARDRLVG